MTGIPPPDGMPRDCWAAWYWDQIDTELQVCADQRGVLGDDECQQLVDNLISGAIEAGVVGHSIPVAGFSDPQPLHSLLAPYRRQPGGLAEREEAERRRALERPMPRWARR